MLNVIFKDPSSSVSGLVDTGSARTFMSLSQCRKWGIQFNSHRENFITADNRKFSTIGSAFLSLRVEDSFVSVRVRVVPSLSSNIILGRDVLRQLPIRLFYGQRLLFSGHCPPVLTPRNNPEVIVGEGLRLLSNNSVHNEAVRQVVLKHKEVVSQWSVVPGLIKDAAFRIPTGDAKPIYRPAIPMSQKHQELLQAHLDDYSAKGMVRPTKSPWGAGTFLVPKPGSTEMRTCHDYRPLNKITERHQHPMPSSAQLLATVGTKNKFFAKVDLRWGYNQIPVEQSDIPKTAITSPCGHHEWLVMGFGFADAPAYFQSTIERIMGDLLNKGAVVYLDDILIYAESFEEFIERLDRALERLNNAGAKIHLGKSDFLPQELKYLGMVFSAKGVSHLPDRIRKLNEYPAPESPKALRSFIGFANYFRTFIKDFAKHEGQLRQLPARNFVYTKEDNASFEALRSAVSSTSVLAPFDPALPVQLHVDASGTGLGAVLCQVYPKGEVRVVAYASRLLSPTEQRYTNTERELLAIEWSVCDRFRLQLTGLTFEVHTDHAALVHECRLKQPTSRIHRMLLKLDAFDCKIVYKQGSLNVAADFLSRLPEEAVSLEQVSVACCSMVQTCDVGVVSVKERKKRVTFLDTDKASPESEVCCSINCHKDRKLVPAAERRQVLHDYHVVALHHLGFKKTYDALCQRFYWPGMARDTKSFINECKVCQQFNTVPKKPVHSVTPIITTAPQEILCIDVMGPLPCSAGKKFVLVAIDHHSKFAWAKATSRVNGFIARCFIQDLFRRFGPWQAVISDNAKMFTGAAFSSLLLDWGVDSRHISPYHPEANGTAERFVRTLRELQRKNSSPTTWALATPQLVSAYNYSKHTATSAAPVEVFFNQSAKLFVDGHHGVHAVAPRLASGFDKYRQTFAKPSDRVVCPGSLIWHVPRLKTKLTSGLQHFQPKKFGPYSVVGPARNSCHVMVSDGRNRFTLPLWEVIPRN
jgi:hypothetical protein